MKYDFSGWVTRNDMECADGLVIRDGAFKDCDGTRVPMVWHHLRDDPSNILGYVQLENRPGEGVYGYGCFNNTEKGQIAKKIVEHGDLNAMSIHANRIKKHNGRDVVHGMIREVSLVVAGANPGAMIETLAIDHDGIYDDVEDELIIKPNYKVELYHEEPVEIQNGGKEELMPTVEHAEEGGKTIQQIFDSMTDEQKNAVYAMIGYALSDEGEAEQEDPDDDSIKHEEDEALSHNVFDRNGKNETETLTHEEITAVFKDAEKYGSLKNACIDHGIDNLEVLLPDAKSVDRTPTFIDRDQGWVMPFWNGLRKVPFSRIKSTTADITKDEARARGYIKGKKKIEEQFALLKRATTPTTIYKKQGLDRDDIIDITDFDIVIWMKAEMRQKLYEELARAALVGDGRLVSDDSKINESNIRPIWTDDDMYTIKYNIGKMPENASREDYANAVIDAANIARIDYKGSGNPIAYMDPRTVTEMLLAKDKLGYRIYKTMGELATALRVREIVEVPILDGLTRTTTPGAGETAKTMKLHAIIVNPSDYAIGADRGGAVAFFDDFDIDYNKYKYLIETRCSGALLHPYSAMVIESEVTA